MTGRFEGSAYQLHLQTGEYRWTTSRNWSVLVSIYWRAEAVVKGAESEKQTDYPQLWRHRRIKHRHKGSIGATLLPTHLEGHVSIDKRMESVYAKYYPGIYPIWNSFIKRYLHIRTEGTRIGIKRFVESNESFVWHTRVRTTLLLIIPGASCGPTRNEKG